jgi:hypothetical protein
VNLLLNIQTTTHLNLNKMKDITFKIYLFTDSSGKINYVVCEDSSSTVMVYGMRDQRGRTLHFEAEAYHLPIWCQENGIALKVIDRTEKFSDLWGS